MSDDMVHLELPSHAVSFLVRLLQDKRHVMATCSDPDHEGYLQNIAAFDSLEVLENASPAEFQEPEPPRGGTDADPLCGYRMDSADLGEAADDGDL